MFFSPRTFSFTRKTILLKCKIECLMGIYKIFFLFMEENQKSRLLNPVLFYFLQFLFFSKWMPMLQIWAVRKRSFVHVRQTEASDQHVHSHCLIGIIIDSQGCKVTVSQADNEYSDQTARMRRLIWVFVGCKCPNVRFLKLRLIWNGQGRRRTRSANV